MKSSLDSRVKRYTVSYKFFGEDNQKHKE